MLKYRLCWKIRYVIHARRFLKQCLMNSLKYELIMDSIIPAHITLFIHTCEFITLILHRFHSKRFFFVSLLLHSRLSCKRNFYITRLLRGHSALIQTLRKYFSHKNAESPSQTTSTRKMYFACV